MDRTIEVSDLEQNLTHVLEEAAGKRLPYVLTRENQPDLVLLPYERYIRYLRLDATGVEEAFDQLLEKMARVNARYSEEEVEADLIEATREIRERRRK